MSMESLPPDQAQKKVDLLDDPFHLLESPQDNGDGSYFYPVFSLRITSSSDVFELHPFDIWKLAQNAVDKLMSETEPSPTCPLVFAKGYDGWRGNVKLYSECAAQTTFLLEGKFFVHMTEKRRVIAVEAAIHWVDAFHAGKPGNSFVRGEGDTLIIGDDNRDWMFAEKVVPESRKLGSPKWDEYELRFEWPKVLSGMKNSASQLYIARHLFGIRYLCQKFGSKCTNLQKFDNALGGCFLCLEGLHIQIDEDECDRVLVDEFGSRARLEPKNTGERWIHLLLHTFDKKSQGFIGKLDDIFVEFFSGISDGGKILDEGTAGSSYPDWAASFSEVEKDLSWNSDLLWNLIAWTSVCAMIGHPFQSPQVKDLHLHGVVQLLIYGQRRLQDFLNGQ